MDHRNLRPLQIHYSLCVCVCVCVYRLGVAGALLLALKDELLIGVFGVSPCESDWFKLFNYKHKYCLIS